MQPELSTRQLLPIPKKAPVITHIAQRERAKVRNALKRVGSPLVIPVERSSANYTKTAVSVKP